MLSFKRFNKKVLFLLFISSLLHNAYGQQLYPDDWYQVEIIIFTQTDSFGDEEHPQEPLLSYPKRLVFLETAQQLFPELPPTQVYNETLAALMVPDKYLSREQAKRPSGFVPLDSAQRNLNPDANALRRNGDYRILFHTAWRQPVKGRNATPWIYIEGGEKFGKHRELEGSVRIYRSRLFHMEFNLWLSEFEPGQPLDAAGQTVGSPSDPGIAIPDTPQPPMSKALQQLNLIDTTSGSQTGQREEGSIELDSGMPRYQIANLDVMKLAQQIGLNDLTYFDHPRMGALVLITPLAPED